MACALPHAIGAQTAYPGRQVIALAGDGGLTMLFGELLTLVQNNLPVKVIVFGNSSLNFVELEMKAAGVVNFGTELKNPNFGAVAQAIGCSDAGRAPRGSGAGSGRRAGLRRAGTGRCGGRASGIVHSASDIRRAGQGIHAVRDPHHPGGRADELLDLVSTNVPGASSIIRSDKVLIVVGVSSELISAESAQPRESDAHSPRHNVKSAGEALELAEVETTSPPPDHVASPSRPAECAAPTTPSSTAPIPT